MSKAHFTLKLFPVRNRVLKISQNPINRRVYSLKKVSWSRKPYFMVGERSFEPPIHISALEEIKGFH